MRRSRAEIERLVREGWASGRVTRAIAAEAGISNSRVSQVANELGLPPRRTSCADPERVATLRPLWFDKSLTLPQIVARSGYTESVVRGVAAAQGWGLRKKGVELAGVTAPWARWRPEEDVKLARLWREGLSAVAIAKRMKRTSNAVLQRRLVLGLPEREKGWHPAQERLHADIARISWPATRAQIIAALGDDPVRARALLRHLYRKRRAESREGAYHLLEAEDAVQRD